MRDDHEFVHENEFTIEKVANKLTSWHTITQPAPKMRAVVENVNETHCQVCSQFVESIR